MSGLKNKLMIIIFTAFLAIFSAGSIINSRKDFSENENRYLQELPDFSGESLLDGTFSQDAESYVSDRLTGRETLIGLKNSILKFLGAKDAGGVYFCDDNYYIEKKTDADVDTDIYKKNLKALKLFYSDLSEKGFSKESLSFMAVPTAATVLSEKLPANSSCFDEKRVIDDAKTLLGEYNVIDVTGSVEEISYPYYKTDHHWTTDSAFAAYFDWCEATGRNGISVDDFDVRIVSDSFRGTLYSKVLCRDAARDTVKIYVPNELGEYTVTCDGEVKNFDYGFWDKAFESQKDTYAGFYGGNYGVVHIAKSSGGQELSVEKREKILVIKDSFANCFVPFLYEHFDDVYMVDLRYFNENLSGFVEEKGITEVLSLFNVSTFVEEKSIRKAGII